MSQMHDQILRNYQEILDDILRLSSKTTKTTLIIVTKNQPTDIILPLLKAGHVDFGENKVQEAQQKWPELKRNYPQIRLHLIGPLQTNKVKSALLLFDVIASLDREKLAQELAKYERTLSVRKTYFIQVNTGNEPQKAGISPPDLKDFYQYCTKDLSLNVQGLQCIPPLAEEPTPHFKQLKELAKQNNIPELSMGMSEDYKIALSLGTNYIRIGQKIFSTLEDSDK